jgi:hypothetical protein
MKLGKYEIRDGYVAGTLAVCTFFAGAFMANLHTSYNKLKLERSGIEFKTWDIEKKQIIKGLPEHKFPAAGVFMGGKAAPYITYIYENVEKRNAGDPAMSLISSMDNGINDVRITREKKCQKCHRTMITPQYPNPGYEIGM